MRENPRESDKSRGGSPDRTAETGAWICPVCGKPVIDLQSAIAERDSELPMHFDCAIERVAVAESLGPGEKLVYCGGGNFAVVEYLGQSETLFVVKRRIPYEKEGQKREWRIPLRAKGL